MQLFFFLRYITDFEQTLLKDVEIEIEFFKNVFNRSIINLDEFGYDASKHPFKIYRTLRRMVNMLPKLMNSIPVKTGNFILRINVQIIHFYHHFLAEVKEIQRLITVNKLPKESDLETSMFNTLRLNQMYKLSFMDVSLYI
jgi:hypothetical protein